MKYEMRLDPIPFDQIKVGRKTMELRLNDPRRQPIKRGDLITFSNTANEKEQLVAKVVSCCLYPSFVELFNHVDKTKLGYLENEIADPTIMRLYYTLEDEKKYGVKGITIKLLSKS
jgi:ASC-1-like (ASCH) protein